MWSLFCSIFREVDVGETGTFDIEDFISAYLMVTTRIFFCKIKASSHADICYFSSIDLQSDIKDRGQASPAEATNQEERTSGCH